MIVCRVLVVALLDEFEKLVASIGSAHAVLVFARGFMYLLSVCRVDGGCCQASYGCADGEAAWAASSEFGGRCPCCKRVRMMLRFLVALSSSAMVAQCSFLLPSGPGCLLRG